MLKIDIEKCVGCRLCEKNCPYGAIIVDRDSKKAKILDGCTLCGSCVNVCKFGALSIERRKVPKEELNTFSGIMIWGELEQHDDRFQFKKVVYELLGKANELNESLNQEISVVVFHAPEQHIDYYNLYKYGCSKIYLAEDSLLGSYSTDGFTKGICTAILNKKPNIFLFGATPNGRDLAPRVAARLGLGLTADCTALEINDSRQLLQTRPAFGGNIMASILSPYTRPQMSTVRPNNFPVNEPINSVDPNKFLIKKFELKLTKSSIRTKIIKEINQEFCGSIPIENAEIVISVGRGIGSKENIKLADDLAQVLNGSVASSRALVELGWTEHTIQVGQSGKTIAPKLYIALGISGAIQHLVGMQTSDTIIAINSDPDAPIFKHADFGIVGNVLEIVPQLINILRKIKIQN